jgi:hypothetical protein
MTHCINLYDGLAYWVVGEATVDDALAEPMAAQNETAPIEKTEAALDAKPRLSCAAA